MKCIVLYLYCFHTLLKGPFSILLFILYILILIVTRKDLCRILLLLIHSHHTITLQENVCLSQQNSLISPFQSCRLYLLVLSRRFCLYDQIKSSYCISVREVQRLALGRKSKSFPTIIQRLVEFVCQRSNRAYNDKSIVSYHLAVLYHFLHSSLLIPNS